MKREKKEVKIKYVLDGAEVPNNGERFILESGGIGYILHQYHDNEYADDLAQYPNDLVEEKDNLFKTLEGAKTLVSKKGGTVLYVEKPICIFTEADYKHFFDTDDFVDFQEY